MARPADAGVGHEQTVLVLGADDGPLLDLVEGGGWARAVVWPGMGARHRSMHRMRLGPRAATRELRHPSDAVYAVIDGDGAVQDPGPPATSQPLSTGSMVHIDAGTAYRLLAGDTGIEVVGGPAPPDPGLYRGVA